MPSFSKSPPELVERFSAITVGIPDAERRQMFGYPCLFVGGNMVTGLYESAWFVRLAEPDRGELLRVPGAGPFEPMPGRPMGGYTVLPPSIVADDRLVRSWVERAIAFGRSLPARTPKASKPKRSSKPA
jgi:TfoX/Sxy family transcriptional regulator of competence genes